MPDRAEWLLRYIDGRDSRRSVDHIRLMKGMFLFTKSPAAPKELDYHFEPYDYGPLLQKYTVI